MEYFCLDCYNERLIKNGKKPIEEKDAYLGWTFCEDCEEWLRCVIAVKSKGIFGKIKYNMKVSKWERAVQKAKEAREKNRT